MPAARRLLFILMLAAPIQAHAVPLLTADYTGLPVGAKPRLLVAGDLNGDGVDDLVVDDEEGLGCLVARGDGTFAPRKQIQQVHASAMVIAELTGDGKADLAITGQEQPFVLIYLGNGDGTFGPIVGLPFRSESPGLIARDFDGNGLTDLVASDPASRSIWAWFAKAGSTFPNPPVTTSANVPPGPLLAGDLDGDGALDLFLLHDNAQAGFTLMRNSGHGAFGPPTLYDGPGGSKLGSTGDFNGDGIPDVAIPESVRYPPDYFVAVWSGRRDGTFAGPTLYPTCGLAAGTTAGDLDDDGFDDLVVAADRYQCLLRGSASGLLHERQTVAYQMSGPIVVGRFDGDDALDVAALEASESGGGGISGSCFSYVGGVVFVWRGDGEGEFQAAARATEFTYVQVLAADLDEDGHQDLVCRPSGSLGEVHFLRGRGDGTFEEPLPRIFSSEIRSLQMVDIDGDGRLELVAIAGGSLVVERVAADFGLEPVVTRPVGSSAFRFAAGDFDGDGRIDFAVTNQFLPIAVRVFLAGSDFLYREYREFPLPSPPSAIAASDLDHDGKIDLLVGASFGSLGLSARLLHYWNSGDATFAFVDSVDTEQPPVVLAVLDRGKKVDPMVIAGTGSSSCYDGKGAFVFKSVDGVFAREQGPLILAGRPLTFDLADLDGDGIRDLVAACSRGRIVTLRGLPDGTFGARLDFGLPVYVRGACVADFDEDGRPDVAVATDGETPILMNRGGAVYSPPAVAARLGAGGAESVLHYGETRALSLVIAGTEVVDVRTIVPSSVRLAGASAIPGRVLEQDGVAVASPALDACSMVLDDLDGRADLEVQFRADEVVDAWLNGYTTSCPECVEGQQVALPFTARRVDGTTVTGHACAVIVGAPIVDRRSAPVSLRAFGVSPDFEVGVGVVLTVPGFVRQADVSVYDIAGRRVASLFHGSLGAGVHRLTWAGGSARPGPGIYFARGDVDGTRLTARILVAR